MKTHTLSNIGHLLFECSTRISINRICCYSMAVIGFLFAVTRIFGDSPDYFQYEVFFDLVRQEGLHILTQSRFEPGFSLFSVLLTTFITTNVVVYGWFVGAAMLLKGWAISAYSSSWKIFLVISIFYISRYFPLHELTQLRVACAIAIILVGSIFIWQGSIIFGLIICFIALGFHISVAAIIPTLFLRVEKRWKVITIGLFVFVFVYTFSEFITNYLGNLIRIIEVYQTDGFGDNKPNPFAAQLLIDWAILFISLGMWNKLSKFMRRIVLLELIGIAIFYGGIEFAVIAHRLREMYSVFWIFFVADGMRYRDTKLMSYSYVFISVIFYIYLFFFARNFFG